MSCKQYESDLSRALDGRLPATERAEVMHHVDGCDSCQETWQQLRAAQTLVLSHLSEPAVRPDFRDEVWSRIHAGEGAPEVLLQEPVGFGTKLRYGMVGAAAAAALLIVYHLSSSERATAPSPDSQQTAQVEDQPIQGGLQPRPPQATQAATPESGFPGALRPRSQAFGGPQILAEQAVRKVATAHSRLRRLAPEVQKPEAARNIGLLNAVRSDLRTIKSGLFVLDNMGRHQIVQLDANSRECIAQARTTLRLREQERYEDLRQVVTSLTSCSLDQLPEQASAPLFHDRLQRAFMEMMRSGNPTQWQQVFDVLQMQNQARMLFIQQAPGGAPRGEIQLLIQQIQRK